MDRNEHYDEGERLIVKATNYVTQSHGAQQKEADSLLAEADTLINLAHVHFAAISVYDMLPPKRRPMAVDGPYPADIAKRKSLESKTDGIVDESDLAEVFEGEE